MGGLWDLWGQMVNNVKNTVLSGVFIVATPASTQPIKTSLSI